MRKSKNKGMKDTNFVFMVTDSTLQDEWSVLCAKADIYANHLDEQIEKVWLQADGAGCFVAGQLNCVVQPLWQSWSGISEEQYRISPRGGGKMSLNGIFTT
jgi:hypothetical protein